MTVSRRTGPSQLRYAVAVFLSSGLLFLLEPMAGKRVLPLLGGSAAVWTACLVFFQSALLLGYLAAHWLVTRATPRRQAGVYVTLLLLSVAQLALTVAPELGASTMHPISSVLWLLTVWIGLPFITLSATSPLLQSWWARATAHSADADEVSLPVIQPYRLYAISNVGSLLALVIYPWLLEPRLTLHDQAVAMAVGFALLGLVAGAIAYGSRNTPGMPEMPAGEESDIEAGTDAPGRRVLWIALAACGSLLLSAVTSHLSQNVATIPLLWVIPLFAYLLSFVIGFSGGRWHPRILTLALAVAGLASIAYMVYHGDLFWPIRRTIAVYCGALFALCLFCHSELYRLRPASRHLTTFYSCVAAGGALGAILVGVVAPMVLPGNYELVFGLCFAAAMGLAVTWQAGLFARAFWFAATASLITLVFWDVRTDLDTVIARTRNFYGTLRVTQSTDDSTHVTERTLYNGVIQHGTQVYTYLDRYQPTTYYGSTSGVGLALDLCCGGRTRRIGVIGLGAGTLAAYGRSGDVIRFYDINPAVPRIAETYFTYLRDSHAQIEVVLGDARVSLARESPQRYDVLVIDAFSGDAIPVHLITSQALDIYRRHLRPGGIIAFHVSNRYLELAPVVQQLAEHAGMGTALITSSDDLGAHLFGSDWVLVTDDRRFLENPLIENARSDITVPPRLRRWTDDYNSLLPILHVRSDTTE